MKINDLGSKIDENHDLGSSIDENQWFGVENYDFGVIKMIFVVKKHVFMMILGTKMEKMKKKRWFVFFYFYFFQNFIFDQEFDSNGPGA